MNYIPETQWIGGKYPGVKVLPLPKPPRVVDEKRVKTYFQPRPSKNAILAVVRSQGPISITHIALALGKNKNLVNMHLLDMQREGLVVKEYRKNKNNGHNQMFYWGVQ